MCDDYFLLLVACHHSWLVGCILRLLLLKEFHYVLWLLHSFTHYSTLFYSILFDWARSFLYCIHDNFVVCPHWTWRYPLRTLNCRYFLAVDIFLFLYLFTSLLSFRFLFSFLFCFFFVTHKEYNDITVSFTIFLP